MHEMFLNLEANEQGEGESENDNNPGDALEEYARHTETTVTDMSLTSSLWDTKKIQKVIHKYQKYVISSHYGSPSIVSEAASYGR